MTAARSPHQLFLPALLLVGWLIALAGCQPLDFYDRTLEQPTPVAVEPPRELAKMSLPAYRIEPPDVLRVEIHRQIPLPPYRTNPYDVLQITVQGTLVDQPIGPKYEDTFAPDGSVIPGRPTDDRGYKQVEADGRVNLGGSYGSVPVAGMTIEEATRAIEAHLQQILKRPIVSVRLAQPSGMQLPGIDNYLVGPDGTVNLRQYGAVYVTGLTLSEAKRAIEEHLAQFLDSPEVWLDVASYNSKVYYIITEGAGQGDNVVRVPVTGNETVLDAISQIRGLSQLSSKNIWIARPAPEGFGVEQHLPIEWDAITRGAATGTNYQVLPGDRIFIAEDGLVATANFIGKLTGPVERVVGFASVFTSAIRNFQSTGRGYNQGRGGYGF